jgi:LysM repeat protein
VAEVSESQKSMITYKVGGKVPVWVIALGLLVLAWLYAKWRSDKASSSDSSKADTADATGSDSPSRSRWPRSSSSRTTCRRAWAPPTTPSAPVTVPPAPPPVTTLPGTIPNPPTTTPTKPVTPPKTTRKPAAKPPIKYVVKHGDTLSAIAKKYKTTTAALWTYNTTPGNRPAATIKTLKARGQNLLYAGETILIPQK